MLNLLVPFACKNTTLALQCSQALQDCNVELTLPSAVHLDSKPFSTTTALGKHHIGMEELL